VKLRLESVLSLFFAAVAFGAVLGAKDWSASTRLFPLLAGIPLLTLSLVQFVIDLKGPREKAEKAMDFQFAKDVEVAVARRRTLNIFAWLFGFTIAIWLIGFHIAIPLTVFLYLKFQGHESWILSIILTAVAYLFFWGVFDQTLHLPLPEGRLLVAIEKLLG
jgi:hypothetical protein